MSDYLERMNQILRPVAPPRVIEGVYTDDQHRRMFDVVKQHGPWPTIASHHFDSVEELIATVTGVPESHGLTLDDIAAPQFRGYFAEDSVVYHPEIRDCFYNPDFIDEIADYWGVPYAKPSYMLFNICGPAPSDAPGPPHLDAVNFRGVRTGQAPVWLQNMMGKSGLFTDHLVKMGQIITWWYTGENGTFTYWPEGPFGEPAVLEHPLVNKGVVVQNEMMFHRGDPVGAFDSPPIVGLKHRSTLGYDADDDRWHMRTDDDVIRTYEPGDIRFLVHWSAELYADRDELRKSLDHSDDLTIDGVLDRLVDTMATAGHRVDIPADPLKDPVFIAELATFYNIAPTTEWLEIPAA